MFGSQVGKLVCVNALPIREIVIALRTAKGWNHPQLAAAVTKHFQAAVRAQNIQQLESGKVKNPHYLPALAKAFGKSYEDLKSWRPGLPEFGPNYPEGAPQPQGHAEPDFDLVKATPRTASRIQDLRAKLRRRQPLTAAEAEELDALLAKVEALSDATR
jgi:transcriptional regulator with XRE-family HTH domain